MAVSKDNDTRVVYLGLSKTNLSERVAIFVGGKVHKKEQIANIRKNGMTLKVRYRDRENAEEEDKQKVKAFKNSLLKEYNYAWNEQQNGIRNIKLKDTMI